MPSSEDAQRIWDITTVEAARTIGKVIEPAVMQDGKLEAISAERITWAEKLEQGQRHAQMVAEMTPEQFDELVAAAGATISDSCLGSKGLVQADCVPHPGSPKDQLNQRLYQIGYNLQQLEEIRRQMADFGMQQVEILINQAIEELANAWMHDRRAYRSMI